MALPLTPCSASSGLVLVPGEGPARPEAGREGGPSADDSPARAEYIIDNFRMFV